MIHDGWAIKTFGFISPAGLERVPVPAGLDCTGCREAIGPTDLGVWMTDGGEAGPCQKPWHRLCVMKFMGLDRIHSIDFSRRGR